MRIRKKHSNLINPEIEVLLSDSLKTSMDTYYSQSTENTGSYNVKRVLARIEILSINEYGSKLEDFASNLENIHSTWGVEGSFHGEFCRIDKPDKIILYISIYVHENNEAAVKAEIGTWNS